MPVAAVIVQAAAVAEEEAIQALQQLPWVTIPVLEMAATVVEVARAV